MVVSAKADFVKTSTGFGVEGAQCKDVSLMKEVVGDFAEVKASGGIKKYTTALQFINAGVSRIGTSSRAVILNNLSIKKEH